MNKFAVDLYQALNKSHSGNILVSPIALQIVLVMAQQGAKGATAAQMAEVLCLPKDRARVQLAYKSLIASLDDCLLKLATTIFVENNLQTFPDFQNIMKKYFLSELRRVDFTKNPTGSRKEINDWVWKNTNHKIKDLLSTDSVTSLSTLALVSGGYFKPNWNHKFKRSNTMDMPFYIKPNLIINVQMMFLKEKPFCIMDSRRLEAQILEIPFVEDLRMIIILPKRLDGLADVETKLTSLDLPQEMLELWLSKVDVYLPRFNLEQTLDLNPILSKMGMPLAFTDEADFSGISNDPLSISQVTQKVCIEVQEGDTESYGHSASGSYYNAPLNVLTQVKCDHPFLFIILAQNEVLFVGRIRNPNEM